MKYFQISQSGPGSYGNEGVLYIYQSSRTGASMSDGLVLYPGVRRGLTPLQRCCLYSTTPAK